MKKPRSAIEKVDDRWLNWVATVYLTVKYLGSL